MTWHARKRIYQRYGIKLKKSDLKKLSEGIKLKYFFRMYTYTDYTHDGIIVIVKYDSKLYKVVCFPDGTILTALPFNVSKNAIDLINLPDTKKIFTKKGYN